MMTKLTIFTKTAFLTLMLSTIAGLSIAEIKVIVNPAVADDIDVELIEKLYLSKTKKFPSGQAVVLYTLPEGDTNTENFVNNVVGKGSAQFKSFWAKLVFTGKGVPPVEVSSDADMIAEIAKTPGAIGFVSGATATDSVRVIGTF